MTVHIEVNIGTHKVELWPEGESLRCVMTWHETVVIHDWTMAKLMDWANRADNDLSYVDAEAWFCRFATGDFPRLRKD